MAIIFVGSWFAQSVTGWTDFNQRAGQSHGESRVSWLELRRQLHLLGEHLQNWQSEFLAVGSFAVLDVFLRQRGSPESKPVGAPHESTGDTG